MTIKTKAAVLFSSPGKFEVVELDLEEPKRGEVLVRMAASGLCHSEDHMATGNLPPMVLPIIGGDEGGGIVEAVGEGVYDFEVGDHVVTSFIPACGKCVWCASGQQQLCDNGQLIGTGSMLDGTYRMRFAGERVASIACIGTFSEYQVLSELSLVKVPKDLPLDVIALVACGVPTGWGSATAAADIRIGDTVIVMGCGGIGMNAVQGAAHKGATHVVAVDPVPLKRTVARQLGATEAFADIAEAADFARSVTNGQGAAVAIVATGVRTGAHVGEAFAAVRKAGTVVITGLGSYEEKTIPVDMIELSMFQKRLQGCVYGNRAPRLQIPELLDLYRAGTLKLDELVTNRYTLDQVNDAYVDLRAGKNIRGLIDFQIL